MKNSKTKRLLASLLVAAISAGTLVGCSNGSGTSSTPKESSDKTSSTASSTDSENSGKEETGPVTLSVLTDPDPYGHDLKENYTVKLKEEMANVNLEFEFLPAIAADSKTKIASMVMSDTLPGIVMSTALDEAAIYDYGSKGFFVDTTEYLNNADLTVNFNNIPDDDKNNMLSNSRSADGKIYAMPTLHNWAHSAAAFRMWTNSAWLEQSGKEVPTTLEEFEELLRYYKEHDMNGNGENDEIALAGAATGWATDIHTFLINSFVYANPGKQYLGVEDGKITAAYTKDAFKDGLTYVKGLIDEGLISPLSFTQDINQLKALMDYEGGMVGFAPAGSHSTFFLTNDFGGAQLIPPLKGGSEDGPYVPYNKPIPSKGFFITKNCEDIEAAVRLADLSYEADHVITQRWGAEGSNWSKDPADLANFSKRMDSRPEEVTYAILDDPWGLDNEVIWGHNYIRYFPESLEFSWSSVKNEDLTDIQIADINQVSFVFENYIPLIPEENIGALNYTPEDSERVAVLQTQIFTYVQEMITAFLTGNASLDTDWESFQSQLQSMNLEEYLTLVQAAYDKSIA